MSLRNSLRQNTNPDYRMYHSERANIQMVTFEKNYKRYEYWFLVHSMESFVLIPRDIQAHREIPLIFNSSLLETLNDIVNKVIHDFNFMNIFCFGKEAHLCRNLEHMIKSIHISGEYLVDYYATIFNFHGELSFMMTTKILFNINTGMLVTTEKFNISNAIHAGEFSFIPNLEDAYWHSFKQKFMMLYAANKIEKNIDNLSFQDAAVVQMMNL